MDTIRETTSRNSYHNPVPRRDEKLLSVDQVCSITGFAQSTVYRRARTTSFPSPQKVWAVAENGAKRLSVRWDKELVGQWMEKQTAPGRSAPRPRNLKPKPLPTPPQTAAPDPYIWRMDLAIALLRRHVPWVSCGASGAIGAILGMSFQSILQLMGVE